MKKGNECVEEIDGEAGQIEEKACRAEGGHLWFIYSWVESSSKFTVNSSTVITHKPYAFEKKQ